MTFDVTSHSFPTSPLPHYTTSLTGILYQLCLRQQQRLRTGIQWQRTLLTIAAPSITSSGFTWRNIYQTSVSSKIRPLDSGKPQVMYINTSSIHLKPGTTLCRLPTAHASKNSTPSTSTTPYCLSQFSCADPFGLIDFTGLRDRTCGR